MGMPYGRGRGPTIVKTIGSLSAPRSPPLLPPSPPRTTTCSWIRQCRRSACARTTHPARCARDIERAGRGAS
eukprot:scaffold111469_cov35-Tisochrysis_lutea.AAC.4